MNTISRKPIPQHDCQEIPPALPSQQLLEPKEAAPQTPRQRRPLKVWLWEVVSAVAAIAILAAVISVLSHYNTKTVPDWPLHININASVAILADLLRASVLVVAAAILSQSKWIWFSRKARPMTQLQSFENARSSLIGSASLLATLPNHAPTIIAAVLTILAVGIGPFTQQSLQTITCVETQESGGAQLPISRFGGLGFNEATQRNSTLHSNVIYGLFNPAFIDREIDAFCPTGNCSFPEVYSSLGICSFCADTTKGAKQNVLKGKVVNMTLDDAFVDNYMQALDISQVVNFRLLKPHIPQAMFDAGLGLATLNFSILAAPIVPNPDPNDKVHEDDRPRVKLVQPEKAIAATCIMYPCIKDYKARIQNGVLIETVVSSRAMNSMSDYNASNYNNIVSWGSKNATALHTPCLVDGKIYTLDNITTVPKAPGRSFVSWETNDKPQLIVPIDCLYLMSQRYRAYISQALEYIFSGNCVVEELSGQVVCSEMLGQCEAREFSRPAFWLEPLLNNGSATFANINETVYNGSTTLTNHMRSFGAGVYVGDEVPVAQGDVQVVTTCIKFEWKWLIFPIVLAAVVLGLLGWSIVVDQMDSTKPVWKNSLLPLLLYGMRSEAERELQMEELDTLEEVAKKTIVILKYSDNPGFEDDTPRTH